MSGSIRCKNDFLVQCRCARAKPIRFARANDDSNVHNNESTFARGFLKRSRDFVTSSFLHVSNPLFPFSRPSLPLRIFSLFFCNNLGQFKPPPKRIRLRGASVLLEVCVKKETKKQRNTNELYLGVDNVS